MRYSRQDKILELIREYEIETQESLSNHLKECGFKVTQATISRDIKELQLIKTLTPSGKYKYAVSQNKSVQTPSPDRFLKIFKSTITSATLAGNIIVLKTLSGCANAAGEAIDSLSFQGIVGSLAGDNTVFVVVDPPEQGPALVKEFKKLIGNI